VSKQLQLEGLNAQEQAKALLESSSFALFVRYARSGRDREVLAWMADRLRLAMGELNRNIKQLDESQAPPPAGRIVRAGRK
jgi:hypothetical protein